MRGLCPAMGGLSRTRQCHEILHRIAVNGQGIASCSSSTRGRDPRFLLTGYGSPGDFRYPQSRIAPQFTTIWRQSRGRCNISAWWFRLALASSVPRQQGKTTDVTTGVRFDVASACGNSDSDNRGMSIEWTMPFPCLLEARNRVNPLDLIS